LTLKVTFKKPIVGVFLSKKQIRNLRARQPLFKLLALAEANLEADNVLFFFSIGDVDFNNDSIKGTYYHPARGDWETAAFPFPDVLYNRRSAGLQNQKVQEFKARLRSLGGKTLNAQEDFDKWHVYEQLIDYRAVRPHLPPTLLYQAESDLEKALAAYGQVYVKACVGRKGQKVMKVAKQTGGGFTYSYYGDRLYHKNAAGLAELVRGINEFIGEDRAILQKALNLISFEGRPVDMLAEMQRGAKGKLGITAIITRVGARASPITNIRSSTEAYRFEDFFQKMAGYSGYRYRKLKKRVDSFLFTIYRRIEDIYGPFGELGLDFGLDTDGKLWFIECNSKSAKVALCQACSTDVIRRAFLNPLLYARYIAGK
jgi:hypothetical protein